MHFIKTYRKKGTIESVFGPIQSSLLWRNKEKIKKYITTRENMSTVMN